MVSLADASFRRGYGSVIIQGGKRAYRLSKAQEKAGVILLVSLIVLSNNFYAKGTLAGIRARLPIPWTVKMHIRTGSRAKFLSSELF